MVSVTGGVNFLWLQLFVFLFISVLALCTQMCMIVEDGALLVLVEWACGGILSGRSSGSVSGSAGRKVF